MRVLAVAVLLVLASCATTAAPGGPAQPPVATTAGASPQAKLSPATSSPAAVTQWPPVPHDAVRAHVTRVVDGDTVVIDGISVGYRDSRGRPGHHARLIGIDTPEVFGHAGCFGRQASAFTKRELAGRDVLVAFDVDRLDRYGRALVYIWKTDRTFFNAELAEDGYALQETVPPNVRYADDFLRYVRDARAARRGLWSACG
jgi:micrococcal nuclease